MTVLRSFIWYYCRRLSTESKLHRTALFSFHQKHGAKFVNFAGWEMPVQYQSESIIDSHNHVRNSCGLFDVSHMLQSKITGADRNAFFESIVVSDIKGLPLNKGTLSVFTNKNGGICDDLIVSNTSEDHLYVVSNAGCREGDSKLMSETCADWTQKGKDVQIEFMDTSLIALQGPLSSKVLQPLVKVDLSNLSFMNTTLSQVGSIADCRISRCGYTGEDGFEISVLNEHVEDLTDLLLASKAASVKPIGLGARDTLRLEAGLCLYGNDIDETTTPVEAALSWTIGKRRRKAADFPGADIILNQLKNGVKRKRVGLICRGPPARAGAEIYDASGENKIGHVTSGCPSPTKKINIAMGYVELVHTTMHTPVQFKIRGKLFKGSVTKLPFVKSNYYVKGMCG